MAAPAVSKGRSTETFVDNKRKDDIRMANIAAAQSVWRTPCEPVSVPRVWTR
ncbi:UNVERIFIED_CONTAM: hypothetical protein Sradi_1070200 [Sesamum radiatum]|uniref:Uncharacterized protein n=1 Tax=Sesamum radiatum TaxID=300843 RepID=A0AAW2V8L8_SESRA